MTPNKPGSGPDRRIVVGAVVGAVIVALAAIVVVASRGDDSAPAAAKAEYGAVDVAGPALPSLPDTGADPAVGSTAPAITSETPSGTVTVDPTQETQPVMLVFLAHWCPHCQAELPRLVQLQDAGELDGIRAVAVLIATDPRRPNYPPSEWLDRERWAGDRLFDDVAGTAAQAYGVTSFPFIVFLDGAGTVAERLSGEQPPGAIEQAVEALLS